MSQLVRGEWGMNYASDVDALFFACGMNCASDDNVWIVESVKSGVHSIEHNEESQEGDGCVRFCMVFNGRDPHSCGFIVV